MKTTTATYELRKPSETMQWGGRLASAIMRCSHFITQGTTIYLNGPLGSGKTTLVKGLFRSLGISDNINSPTFGFIHTYDAGAIKAFHIDLYRLNNPLAANILDLDLYHGKPQHIMAVEWPENGVPVIPPADIEVSMEDYGTGRMLTMSIKNGSLEKIIVELNGDCD